MFSEVFRLSYQSRSMIVQSQNYQLLAGFTPTEFSEVCVWCEKFSVLLGVAKLSVV